MFGSESQLHFTVWAHCSYEQSRDNIKDQPLGASVRWILFAAALAALTGCVSNEEIAAADHKTCSFEYGAKPGSDAYVACRMHQQGIHAAQEAQRAEALRNIGKGMQTG